LIGNKCTQVISPSGGPPIGLGEKKRDMNVHAIKFQKKRYNPEFVVIKCGFIVDLQ
jgi:hypothetical protein